MGLDFVRAWHICYNPLNDQVVLLTRGDPRIVSAADEEGDDPYEDSEDDGGSTRALV